MSEEKYEVRIRPEKEAIVAEMKEKLASQGVVLVSFNKLDVKNATLLRRKFLAHGVEYKVIKNTLTRIAADELGLEGLDDLLAGPNGLATCKDDPVAPAAALKEFFKETKSEAIVVKAGVLDGKVIDAKAVQHWQTCRPKNSCWVWSQRPCWLRSPDWHVPSTATSRTSHMLSKHCVNRKNLRKIYA